MSVFVAVDVTSTRKRRKKSMMMNKDTEGWR